MLTEVELKVLRIALHPVTGEEEWTTAAMKFVRLLRKRSATADEFGGNGSAPMVIPKTQPDYGLTVMPYGKHKGELFKDISPWYLRGQLEWIEDPDDPKLRWKNLAGAIRSFLAI